MTLKYSKGERKPPRFVIYGAPKVGKSTLAADMPEPLFIPTEDGIDGLSVARTPRPSTWSELLSTVKDVVSEKHTFQSLVLDTVTGAADLCAQHVCKEIFGGQWGDKGFGSYGKGWAATSEEFRALLALLDQVRAKGMIIMLLAHTGVLSVKNPDGSDYTKWSIEADRKIVARITAWADIIGRADFQHSITKERGESRGKVVSTDTRIISFSGSMAADGGARVGYELPPELPLSWSAIAEHLGRKSDVADEVRKLWHLLPADRSAKVLSYLGIKSLADIEQAPAQKAATTLNQLQKLAAKAATTKEA
jgi:hypothetical protein